MLLYYCHYAELAFCSKYKASVQCSSDQSWLTVELVVMSCLQLIPLFFQPCAMINNDACPPATNSGADDVHSSEEISAMLAVAFDALDERFPSGLSSSLFPAPTSPATSAPQADEDVTDGLLADLLPTTITEVNEQSQAEELNKPATVSVVTKRKSRKRAVSSKRRAEVPKVPKLELDVSTLAVEQKANESKQQAIRRVKNNVASKVFRSKRKSKLENMLTQEANLDKENATLRRDLSLVTEVVSLLKEGLVSRCHARPSQIS